MKRRFDGKVAVVTGGSSGMGRAACVALAREGARVVVVGRTRANVDGTLARLAGTANGGGHVGLCLDVRAEGDMEAMAERALAAFGRIDVLIASAGISAATAAGGGRAPVADLDPAAWDEILDTNLKGVFLANRAVLPAMMRQGEGEILNVSSSLGMARGWAFASAYCASKFAVLGLSESLAEEARPFGVRVQVLLPDAVDTPMLARSPLAVPGAVPGETIAACMLEMLAAPRDAALVNPVVEPFGPWEKIGRRKALGDLGR